MGKGDGGVPIATDIGMSAATLARIATHADAAATSIEKAVAVRNIRYGVGYVRARSAMKHASEQAVAGRDLLPNEREWPEAWKILHRGSYAPSFLDCKAFAFEYFASRTATQLRDVAAAARSVSRYVADHRHYVRPLDHMQELLDRGAATWTNEDVDNVIRLSVSNSGGLPVKWSIPTSVVQLEREHRTEPSDDFIRSVRNRDAATIDELRATMRDWRRWGELPSMERAAIRAGHISPGDKPERVAKSLRAISDELPAATRPDLQPLLEHVRALISNNLDRLSGGLHDGYQNFPESGELGEIASGTRILADTEASASTDHRPRW